MENTDRISPGRNTFARVPAFGITPSPRCFTIVEGPPRRKCGEHATRRRAGNQWFADTFHCTQHAEPTDLELAGECIVRRVRVTCDVLLAGVDERQGIAQTEAVARVEAAIAAAGGVLDVKMVTSQIGRYPASGGAQGVPTVWGSRE
jgi:hypothetical protein